MGCGVGASAASYCPVGVTGGERRWERVVMVGVQENAWRLVCTWALLAVAHCASHTPAG